MWKNRSNLCIVFVKMKCETSRSSLSIPSSSRTFQKFIVHWYKRVHIPAYLRFGSKHFRRSNCVLERVCVRAALEKILTVLRDVVGWRQHTCSSRNAAHLAFSFPMPLAAVCSQGQKQSFIGLLNDFPGMWLEKNLSTKKDVKYVTALCGWKLSQTPSLNDSSQKHCCLCFTNPVLDLSQAFGLSRSALEPDTERLQCCSWHGGSCSVLMHGTVSARQM